MKPQGVSGYESKVKFAAFAALAVGVACAMPTRQEIAETRSLVAELMAPALADYKAKTKSAAEVADVSIGFAESAKSEAARYLLLRGAVSFYVRSGEYGKAADTVEKLKADVKDVPPAEIVDVISSALGRENSRKSPRLYSQLQLAQAQVKASKDVKRLAISLKQVSYDQERRQYAEALALCGNWNASLAEFAKVSGNIGKTARTEIDGSAKAADLGDFWWAYEASYVGGTPIFRERALSYYRKAMAEGNLDGLKKTLIEQRLASFALPDVDDAAVGRDAPSCRLVGRDAPIAPSAAGSAGAPRTPPPSGLIHRWSFTDGFADSVGNVAPSKSDNATVEDGHVTLQTGSPLEFPAGTVPLAPFTVQVWASATDKGLGSEGDFIFKSASSPDGKEDAFWTWTAGKKWVSRIGGFGDSKKVGHGKLLLDGKMHLYTVTGEKGGKGVALKFYQDDMSFGEMTTKFNWKKSPALILGGFVTPTYDEVRVYSRALPHAEIITSLNEGPDKLPELGKGK